MRTFLFGLLLILCGCSTKTSEQSDMPLNEYGNQGYVISCHPRHYICYRTTETLTIDGRADELSWQRLPWSIDFVDILGDHFPKPHYLTRAKMMWDDDYVYFVAEMKEPHLRALYDTERIDEENSFNILIDVDGNTHHYQELVVNASGTTQVRTFEHPNGQPELWSKGKSSQVGIMVHREGTLNDPSDQDHYWSLEVAFPISLLTEGYDTLVPRRSVQWRVNFARTYWNFLVVDGFYKREINSATGQFYPAEKWVWSPIGQMDLYMPELWGIVQFSEIVAGQGRDTFVDDPDEDLKWELRNIYYAQQRYFDENSRFAKRFGQLKTVGFIPGALRFKPQMDGDQSSFTIEAKSVDKKRVWKLNDQGMIWMETVVSMK